MKKKDQQKLRGLQQAAADMTTALQTALADEQQFYRYVYAPKGELPTEVVLCKADTRAMKEMAATLKEMTALVRNLHDLPGAPLSPAPADAPAAEQGVIVLG